MNELSYLELHGDRVAYRDVGQGPALLLIHGMAGNFENWQAVIEPLARHHTVVAPDLPGHGGSAPGGGDYSIGALAAELRDLLVALGHERATLVGHSLGGGIAMQFSYQFPERCERLVLVDSGGLGRDVSLRVDVGRDVGLRVDVGRDVGLRGGLGRDVGLRVDLGRDIGLRVGIIGVHNYCDGGDCGEQFIQKFQALWPEPAADQRHPGGVAAGPVEACHQAGPDRVETHEEHDREGGGRGLRRKRGRRLP